MSRKTRTVRPFNLSGKLTRSLGAVTITYDKRDIASGGHIDLGEEELPNDSVTVNWASDETSLSKFIDNIFQGCHESGVSEEAVSLIVIAFGKYLKMTEIFCEMNLSTIKCLGRTSTFQITEDSVLSATHHDRDISVVLLMNTELKPVPLRPWRKGTWLARADYRIKKEKHVSLFRPTPLDDHTREKLNLPKECMRYVYFGETDILSPIDQTRLPLFYIDEGIFNKLVSVSSTVIGKQLQCQIAIDFMSSAVYFASEKLNEDIYEFQDDEETLESLIGIIVKNVIKGIDVKPTARELIDEVREEPRMFIARVEHIVKTRSTYQSLLNRAA